MVRSLYTTTKKTFCFNCDKMTETINEKKEYWEDRYIIKGKCEVCSGFKEKYCAKRYGEHNVLLI